MPNQKTISWLSLSELAVATWLNFTQRGSAMCNLLEAPLEGRHTLFLFFSPLASYNTDSMAEALVAILDHAATC